MKTNKKTRRIRAIAVGPEEHKRLKILAANQGVTMADLMNAAINDAWDLYHVNNPHKGATLEQQRQRQN